VAVIYRWIHVGCISKTVMAATECAQTVFCNLTTFMCATLELLLLFG